MFLDMVKDGRFLFKGCQRPKGERYRRSGQQEVRTTGGEDNGRRGQGEERTAGGVDSKEDNGRSGQLQGWIIKRAVFTFKKVVFNI